MGGVVGALGAAAVPALLKTALDANTLTTAKSFLKTRVWDWSTPQPMLLSTPSAGEPCAGGGGFVLVNAATTALVISIFL